MEFTNQIYDINQIRNDPFYDQADEECGLINELNDLNRQLKSTLPLLLETIRKIDLSGNKSGTSSLHRQLQEL